jgi:hypothetical protein
MNFTWDIYEIESDTHALHGVKLRGRIRKFSIENDIVCLSENASDKENVVRFALLTDTEEKEIVEFVQNLLPGVSISQVMKAIENPTLSKILINDHTRYSLE